MSDLYITSITANALGNCVHISGWVWYQYWYGIEIKLKALLVSAKNWHQKYFFFSVDSTFCHRSKNTALNTVTWLFQLK